MGNPSSGQNSGAPAGGGGDREANRIRSLDERFGAIESEQRAQRGILEQLRDALTGDDDGGGGGGAVTGDPAPGGADMGEQMRQAIRDVRAEDAAAEAERQHAADHDRLRQPPAERQPREVGVRGRDRLQRVLFGGDR